MVRACQREEGVRKDIWAEAVLRRLIEKGKLGVGGRNSKMGVRWRGVVEVANHESEMKLR